MELEKTESSSASSPSISLLDVVDATLPGHGETSHSSSRDDRSGAQPALILGTWCYRDVFKEQLKWEIWRQRQNASVGAVEAEESAVQDVGSNHRYGHRIPFNVEMLTKVLYNTEVEVQRRMFEYSGFLISRNPHRFRLMKDFERPANLPDKIFMERLWEEFRASEILLCEEHLGPGATDQEGGYRKAFRLLQGIHGLKQMDNLLREKVRRRLKEYLSHNTSIGPLALKSQPATLGSRRIESIKLPMPPDPVHERKDPPEGAFGGRKRAKTDDSPTPILVPRHLPNLAEQHHHARATIERPRRKSALSKEIRYTESSETYHDVLESETHLGEAEL